MARLTAPLVVMARVTSTSTTWLSATAPRLASWTPSMAGLVVQVIASGQLVLVVGVKRPAWVESLLPTSRSLAEVTVAPGGRPEMARVRKARLALGEPTTDMLVAV